MNAMSILGGLFALLAGIVGGDPAGCLVYLHQNKAGGTTMKAVLREKLRPPLAGARRGRFGQCAYGEYRTNGCWPPKYWSGAGGVERWLFYGDAVMGMLGAGWLQGRKRVIQLSFNVIVPRARVSETAPTLRERSER